MNALSFADISQYSCYSEKCHYISSGCGHRLSSICWLDWFIRLKKCHCCRQISARGHISERITSHSIDLCFDSSTNLSADIPGLDGYIVWFPSRKRLWNHPHDVTDSYLSMCLNVGWSIRMFLSKSGKMCHHLLYRSFVSILICSRMAKGFPSWTEKKNTGWIELVITTSHITSVYCIYVSLWEILLIFDKQLCHSLYSCFFFLSLLFHACICMSFRRHVNNLWIIWKYIGHRTTNKVFELSWFIKYIFYYVEATGRLYGDCLPLSPLLLCPSFLDVCGWWLCSSLVLTSSLPSPSTSSSRGK